MKKTIIITGVTGNLGSAVAKKFIGEGYDVIGTVHKQPLENNFSENSFEKIKVDLLNEENCRQLITSVTEKYGKIDVAVLTAGGFMSGNLASTNSSDIYQQYQQNFETAYNIARPVFIQMLKQGSGCIFLTGSRQGLDVSKGKETVAYSLSKSLIFRLAEILNAEAKGKNVVVSVIVPSIIDTVQNRQAMPDADFSSWVKAEQIADAIYFYSSDKAASIREPVIKIYNQS